MKKITLINEITSHLVAPMSYALVRFVTLELIKDVNIALKADKKMLMLFFYQLSSELLYHDHDYVI
jgi:hypothetical protein